MEFAGVVRGLKLPGPDFESRLKAAQLAANQAAVLSDSGGEQADLFQFEQWPSFSWLSKQRAGLRRPLAALSMANLAAGPSAITALLLTTTSRPPDELVDDERVRMKLNGAPVEARLLSVSYEMRPKTPSRE